ncbi:hypothetical protein MXM51_01640 [Pantoea stewartii]|uniref:hypothetical protein n=1 Tax=Pantoea stewartii TaxID=66269 RepID=UPI002DBEFC81|nr:hypothetical protein [Pantoea stewartii]MEB6533252.1 hypothetical protein [Pantoea stewartii]
MGEEIKISAAFIKGDGSWICRVNGDCTLLMLQEIESELVEFFYDSSKEGTYELTCKYFKGQYGEYGRCELEPGWEIFIDSFSPIPEESCAN